MIQDISGKILIERKNIEITRHEPTSIDVKDLNVGVYFLNIHSNEQSLTLKFLKK